MDIGEIHECALGTSRKVPGRALIGAGHIRSSGRRSAVGSASSPGSLFETRQMNRPLSWRIECLLGLSFVPQHRYGEPRRLDESLVSTASCSLFGAFVRVLFNFGSRLVPGFGGFLE